MNMKNEQNTNLNDYQVLVDTSATALLTVRATSAEQARQIIAQAFGTDTSFPTDMALRRMQGNRRMLGLVSPENTRNEMEVMIGNSIWIRGAKDDHSQDNRDTMFLIREGDEYDLTPENLSMCDCCETCVCYGECSCGDEDSESEEVCLLYLLGQPAELIPMSAVEECAAELGNQLAHECIPDTALFITYNPCSILDVEDARYLIAPALVYGLEDNEPAPMTDEECAAIQKLLAERTVTLTADGEEFHALKLWD